MKIEGVKKSMQKSVKGWESQGRLLTECFTKNAVCDESSPTKPEKDHKEIAKFSGQEISKGGWNMKSKLKNCYNSKR